MIETLEDYGAGVMRARAALLYAVDGPIAGGLMQAAVTEVIVDPDGSVWYDMLQGSLEERFPAGTIPKARLVGIINGIAGLLGKKITDGVLQGELPLDGSRIQAWLQPIAIDGPSLVIRKHRKQGVAGWPALTLDDYDLSAPHRTVLEYIIRERLNLLIVGSTASGKTTFAGAFLNEISRIYPHDRVVTIEDTAELYCVSPSRLQLHASEKVTLRDLIRTAMRARPDRLVIGEVRGPEAIDMIMGMNTGHPGFSTVHGGSYEGGLTRIRQLCRLSGEDTIAADMIADAIQYVLLMRRVPSGPRTVAGIAKVCGYRDDRFQLEMVAA